MIVDEFWKSGLKYFPLMKEETPHIIRLPVSVGVVNTGGANWLCGE